MRRKRENVFAFDVNNYQIALTSLQDSIAHRNGVLIELKSGKVGGFDIGIIVVEEDV